MANSNSTFLNYLKSSGLLEQIHKKNMDKIVNSDIYKRFIQRVEEFTKECLSKNSFIVDKNNIEIRSYIAGQVCSHHKVSPVLSTLVNGVILPVIWEVTKERVLSEFNAYKDKQDAIKFSNENKIRESDKDEILVIDHDHYLKEYLIPRSVQILQNVIQVDDTAESSESVHSMFQNNADLETKASASNLSNSDDKARMSVTRRLKTRAARVKKDANSALSSGTRVASLELNKTSFSNLKKNIYCVHPPELCNPNDKQSENITYRTMNLPPLKKLRNFQIPMKSSYSSAKLTQKPF